MSSVGLVKAIFAGNGEAAAEMFNGALGAKISDALDVKKVEIASNLIAPAPQAETMATDGVSEG
jgi:hypothetical protein